MDREQALARLRDIAVRQAGPGGDWDDDHIEADEILCALLRQLGCGDVVDAFAQINKWYA